MSKARKPLSFLLALVMTFSLMAAVPLTASAQTETIGTTEKSATIISSGETGWYTITGKNGNNVVKIESVIQTADKEGNAITDTDNGSSTTGKAAPHVDDTDAYYLKQWCTYKVTADPCTVTITSISSTASEKTNYEKTIRLFNAGNKTYTLESSSTNNATATLYDNTGTQVVSLSNSTVSSEVTLEEGPYLFVVTSGTAKIVPVDSLTIGGSGQSLSKYDSSDSSSGKDKKQFTIASGADGLYVLKVSYATSATETITLTVTPKSTSSSSSDTPKSTAGTISDSYTTEYVYYLTSGNYIIETENKNETGDVKISIAKALTFSGTGSKSVTVKPNTDTKTNTDQKYNSVFFQFTPSTSGWYTMKVPAYGTVKVLDVSEDSTTYTETKASTDSKLVTPGTEISDTIDNANIGDPDSYSSGWTAYYTAGTTSKPTTYYFEYTPDNDNYVSTASSNNISGSIAISAVSSTTFSNSTSYTISGLTKGAYGYAAFKPDFSGAYSFSVKPADSGTVYDSKPTRVFSAKGVKMNAETSGKYTLEADETYYVEVQTSTGNNPAAKVTVSVDDTEASDNTIKVTNILGKTEGVTVLVSDSNGKTVNGTNGGSYSLVNGSTYTIVAMQDGYYSANETFTADGTARQVVLLPVPYAADVVGSNSFTVKAGTPSSDNIIKVTFSGQNLQKVTRTVAVTAETDETTEGETDNSSSETTSPLDVEGYWVGIKLPAGAVSYTSGKGTWSSSSANTGIVKADTANTDSTNTHYYIDAFPGGTQLSSAWIRLSYASGESIVCQLDLSSLTHYEGSDGDPEFVAITDESEGLAVAQAYDGLTDTEKKLIVGKEDDDSDDLKVDFNLSSDMLNAINSEVTSAKSYISKMKSFLNTYIKNNNAQPTANSLYYGDFEFFKIDGVDDMTTSKRTTALTAALEELNTVTVLPVRYVTYTSIKSDSITVDIGMKNRILVSTSDVVPDAGSNNSKTSAKSAVTQYDYTNGRTLRTHSTLPKKSDNTTTQLIQAIDVAENSVTVNDTVTGISIELPTTSFTSTPTNNKVYITHTKSNGKVYVYEGTYEAGANGGKAKVKFTSAHGLSTFVISDELGDVDACIVRTDDKNNNYVTYYQSIEDAVADAKSGETVYILPSKNSGTVTCTTTDAVSLTFKALKADTYNTADDGTNEYIDLKANITIGGTAVSTVSTSDSNGSNPYIMGVWSGSATSTSDATVRRGSATGGSFTLSTTTAAQGDTVTVVVTPSTGYTVSGLSVVTSGGSSVSVTKTNTTTDGVVTYTFVMPSADYVTVTPSFTATTGAVTLVSATGGTLKTSANSAPVGNTVTITATPNTGYKLNTITAKNTTSGASVPLTASGTNTYTFTMVAGGVTITPTWVATTGVTLVTATGGTLTSSPSTVTNGTVVTITATPNSGYRLSRISAKNTTTGASVAMTQSSTDSTKWTLTMETGGVTVTPVWAAISSADDTVALVPDEEGSVSASSTKPNVGATVTLTVKPDSGSTLTSIMVRTDDGDEPVYTKQISDTKYTFTMPSGTVTVTPEFQTTATNLAYVYADEVQDWAADAVLALYNKGIMNGTSTTSPTFNGKKNFTRGEAWALISRIDGNFVKTDMNPWYDEARDWAMTYAVSDGTNPTNEITREQLFQMIWNYAGQPSYSADALAGYPDAGEVHDWAADGIAWAVENGLVTGRDVNSTGVKTLAPTAAITREEIALLINNYLGTLDRTDTTTNNDTETNSDASTSTTNPGISEGPGSF